MLGASCATRYSASESYRNSLDSRIQRTSPRTVVLFLIDGLPVATLQQELKSDKLPRIKDYFIESANKNYLLRTGFPSVTFPSIGSLLTEQSVDHHGIYGNKIILNQHEVDFESPLSFDKLNDFIRGKNIFNRLKEKNLRTVSLSFTFGEEAGTRTETLDPKAALAILGKDYSYVDTKFIDALENLLKITKPELWPDFIYVHLVGVDFLSHAYGPQSPSVKNYLQSLDKKLQKVFHLLNKAEYSGKRRIVSLLTSDHGTDQTIHTRMDLQKLLPNNVQLTIDEGRFASFNFPTHWQMDKKIEYAQRLSLNRDIDIIAFRENNSVHLISQKIQMQLSYGPSLCHESTFSVSISSNSTATYCPKQIPFAYNQTFYPYFISNMSEYFQAPGHPDLVIIPKSGVSFNQQEHGQHGGPTPTEIFVPLLIRNGMLPQGADIMPLSEVLKFM